MACEDSVAITRADAVAHCRQAEEYLRADERSLATGDHNAAAGTAIETDGNGRPNDRRALQGDADGEQAGRRSGDEEAREERHQCLPGGVAVTYLAQNEHVNFSNRAG